KSDFNPGDIIIGIGEGRYYQVAYEMVQLEPVPIALRIAERYNHEQPWQLNMKAVGPDMPFGSGHKTVRNGLMWAAAKPDERDELRSLIYGSIGRGDGIKSSDKGSHYPRQVMPKVDGKSFHCHCGCNVFTEYDYLKYECNSCREKYKGEK